MQSAPHCRSKLCFTSTKPFLIVETYHRFGFRSEFISSPPLRLSSALSSRRPPCSPSRQLVVAPKAIGFDLPGATPSVSSEKQAEQLLKAASSLLLYQSVLSTKPAKAFLLVLANIARGDPMEHYCDLYRSLAAEGHASWQDYLLDQILRCTDSPFVQLASKAESTAHLHTAVAHDLDVLQQLAVADAVLASWVQFQSGASEAWLAAASSVHGTANGKAMALGEIDDDGVVVPQQGDVPGHALAPLTKQQRLAVCSEIAKSWKWSEAVKLLERYHQCFDRGIVSMHTILKWTGSSLQAQDVLKGVNTLTSPSCNTTTHLNPIIDTFLGQPLDDPSIMPPHTLVLHSDVTQAYREIVSVLRSLSTTGPGAAGVRLVVLPASKVPTMPELAWSLSQHPRVRFIVLCVWPSGDHGREASEVGLMMSGDGFSWPENALFIIASAASAGGQAAFPRCITLDVDQSAQK